LLALIAAGLSLLVFSPGPSFRRDGPAVDFIEQTVGVNTEAAHERLAAGLDDALRPHNVFARSGVVDYDGNEFPTKRMMDFCLENNVGLARYAMLGDEGVETGLFRERTVQTLVLGVPGRRKTSSVQHRLPDSPRTNRG
jgi:hypothetical protein